MTARRTDLHPEVETMLATLEAGFPDVTAYPAAEVRAMITARQAPFAGLPDLRAVRDVTVDGPDGDPLPLRVYVPHAAAPEGGAGLPVIVFAHGGGFVFCSIDSHDEFCRSLAEAAEAVVVSVGYRLAPEHPAPAALEDMYAATVWTAAHAAEYGADPARLAVAGDSAGGLLAATVCQAARERGGPAIAGQILIYPVIDDDFETPSYREYGAGYYNSTGAMRWYWDQYAPTGRDSALVMPTNAETLAGLPPALVVPAELDPPCSSAEAYAARLRADGVPVTEYRLDGLFHGVLTFAKFPLTAGAREKVFGLVRDLLNR